ncbi:undecaprenyl-diphosphatase [Bacillus sp. DNRA2]|uniref:undecaprenyl-diphosphatase n=1 Tax=Bacillus sp. DNRA2 TaxID=2723053 RepID=UPI00145CE459|nr:undecaprenyl-diphosphatase [Bacillus sp. DNRA2]NMD71631.1 undecaprenyl-diphosphatase [Bacillus sp. DNRA2]
MNLSELNIKWFRSINDLGINHPVMNPIFEFFAEYTVLMLMMGTIVFWFTRKGKNRIMLLNAGISFVLAEILGKLAGQLHSNNQPFAELDNVNQLINKAIDNSFPSDHTILLFSVSFSIWFFRKKQGLSWMALAVVTAISRIGVGVHFPFDVLAGALIAMSSAFIIYWLNSKLNFSKKILSIYEKIEKMILTQKKQSKEM